MKFQVNDRVKVTAGTFKGLVGAIVQSFSDLEGYTVKFDDASGPPTYVLWYPNELEKE